MENDKKVTNEEQVNGYKYLACGLWSKGREQPLSQVSVANG